MGQIEQIAEYLDLYKFRGVFMRQLLPEVAHEIECGILNLGDLSSGGTHWTCYVKSGDTKLYFDSFGDAKPPKELVDYLGGNDLFYNTERVQDFADPPICGHLCLEVLKQNTEGNDWEDIMRTVRDHKYGWQSWFPY